MNERKIALEIKMLDNLIARKIIENVKEQNFERISHVQANIIGYLYKNKSRVVYQHEIEKEIGFRRSTISGILKTMEKNNYIVKTSAVTDSRKKEIRLTQESIKKHKIMEDKALSFEKKLLNNINDNELICFFKVIDKLKENLK